MLMLGTHVFLVKQGESGRTRVGGGGCKMKWLPAWGDGILDSDDRSHH